MVVFGGPAQPFRHLLVMQTLLAVSSVKLMVYGTAPGTLPALVPVSSVQRTGAAGALGKGRSPWGRSVEGAVTLPVAFGWKEMPPDPRFLFSSVFF